jgi:hypothetical protein
MRYNIDRAFPPSFDRDPEPDFVAIEKLIQRRRSGRCDVMDFVRIVIGLLSTVAMLLACYVVGLLCVHIFEPGAKHGVVFLTYAGAMSLFAFCLFSALFAFIAHSIGRVLLGDEDGAVQSSTGKETR